jgi:hypothetical protein
VPTIFVVGATENASPEQEVWAGALAVGTGVTLTEVVAVAEQLSTSLAVTV